MTHTFVVDYRPTSTTSGQEVIIPVTILETPPMKIVAYRLYKDTPYGLKTQTETWAENFDVHIQKKLSLPKEKKGEKKDVKPTNKKENQEDTEGFDDIRVIAHTMPSLVGGVPKKIPDVMEIRIGGGSHDDRLAYAQSILGKELQVTDIYKEGSMIDAIAVTKGKGFQGHVKRWGVKLLDHKNSKHRRMIGTLGPWLSWTRPTTPQAGQTGYHKRTEYNKRILKIGENGEELTPNGGFINYGVVRNAYVAIHGSLPGPVKRLVRMRDAMRYTKGVKVEKPDITHISTTSKQGV
jgi:large subunit ribosomal protein L3